MAGVDVSVHTPPSTRGPLRGPQGDPGPPGPRGESGPPGDPAELLTPLAPGEALSVDDAGRPAPLAVVGKLPPGGGNRIVVTNNAGTELPYSVTQSAPTNHAIVQRTATGQAVVADAVNANEAASKSQLDRKARKPLGANCIPALDASSTEIDLLYAEGTNGGSIAKRTSTGAINVSDGLVAQNAVNKGQLDTAVGARVASSVASSSSVYVKNGSGSVAGIGYAVAATADTFALRTATGTLRTAAPADNGDAVPLSLLENRLSAAQRTAINALPTTGATVDQVVAALRAT